MCPSESAYYNPLMWSVPSVGKPKHPRLHEVFSADCVASNTCWNLKGKILRIRKSERNASRKHNRQGYYNLINNFNWRLCKLTYLVNYTSSIHLTKKSSSYFFWKQTFTHRANAHLCQDEDKERCSLLVFYIHLNARNKARGVEWNWYWRVWGWTGLD